MYCRAQEQGSYAKIYRKLTMTRCITGNVTLSNTMKVFSGEHPYCVLLINANYPCDY